MSSNNESTEARPEVVALMRSINKLCCEKKYSDLIVQCQGKIWNVHRSIMCTQSTILAAAIDGNWMDGQTRTISLDDDNPAIVEKMIHFCYKTRYHDDRGVEELNIADRQLEQETIAVMQSAQAKGEENSPVFRSKEGTRSPLVTNAKVYILGDKYDIQSLKQVAARKYQEVIKDWWKSPTFAESAQLVYKNIVSEYDALREIIVEAACQHLAELTHRREFVALLRGNGEIATDILKEVLIRK